MITILAKLVAREFSTEGYIVYIFRNLESTDILDNYIMCVQYPNWEHRLLDVGDIGYATYEEHIAGVDKWFDGVNFKPYNYTHIQFIKFVDKPKTINKKEITL